MREILFHGKRADSGEWVEGILFNAEEDTFVIPHDNEYNYDPTEGLAFDVYGCKVDPETVGQYTGLTDKNGVRIFEGDIVSLIDEHNEIEWTAVVVFGNPNSEYNWGWQLKAIGEFDGNKDILLWVDMEESGAYCEIIGNIHDNPELLE